MAEHTPGRQPADGSPFIDRPKPGDSFQDAYSAPPQAIGMDPRDALPRPVVESSVSRNEAPELSVDTFVCMADTSRFVIRSVFGDVIAEFSSEEVERSECGVYRARRELVRERLKLEIDRTRQKSVGLYGISTQAALDNATDDQIITSALAVADPDTRMSMVWIEVQPLRPQCKYYARQLIDFDGRDPERTQIERLCTARRTDAGEFLSLGDMRMHACELRNPRHASQLRIDVIDAEKVAEAEKKRNADQSPVFDVERELANQEG